MSWAPDGLNEWGPRAEPPACPPGPASGPGTCLAQSRRGRPRITLRSLVKIVVRLFSTHIRTATERPKALPFTTQWKLENGPIALVLGIREMVRLWISKMYPSMIVAESITKIQTPPSGALGPGYTCFGVPSPMEGGTEKLGSLLRAGSGKPFSQEACTERKSRQGVEGLSSCPSCLKANPTLLIFILMPGPSISTNPNMLIS